MRTDRANDTIRAETTMVEFERGASGSDITTKKPYELARLQVGRRRCFAIEVLGLDVLSILKLCAKFGVNDVESRGQISSGGNRGAFSDLGLEGWIETEVREEGCLSSGGIDKIVERELGEGEIIDPVILVIRHVGPKVRFERLVRTLGKAVGLGVIRGGSASLDVEERHQFVPELGDKY